MPTMDNLRPVGTFGTLTVTDAAGGVPFPANEIPAWATHVYVCAETAASRFTIDGVTAPTAAVGFLVEAGDKQVWPVSWVTTLKAFRTTGTSAVWNYQYLQGV